MPTLAAFIAEPARQRGLQPRDDIREPGWTFWELRTLNRHRVVGLVTEHRQFKDARDLEAEIRGVVSRHFKCAWWRGMAYGVVADVPTISLQPDDLKVLVDVRENSNGTLQWVVLAAGAISLATPMTQRQSGRLGVMLISRRVSFKPRASPNSIPKGT